MNNRPEPERSERGLKADPSPRDCAHCLFLAIDERTGDEFCDCGLDEDEYATFLSSVPDRCPYFRLYDEYGTVRKQN